MGEEFSAKDCDDMCDNCRKRKGTGSYFSFLGEAQMVADFVNKQANARKRLTVLQTAKLLHGSDKKKCEDMPFVADYLGLLKHRSIGTIKNLILKLLLNNVSSIVAIDFLNRFYGKIFAKRSKVYQPI